MLGTAAKVGKLGTSERHDNSGPLWSEEKTSKEKNQRWMGSPQKAEQLEEGLHFGLCPKQPHIHRPARLSQHDSARVDTGTSYVLQGQAKALFTLPGGTSGSELVSSILSFPQEICWQVSLICIESETQ